MVSAMFRYFRRLRYRGKLCILSLPKQRTLWASEKNIATAHALESQQTPSQAVFQEQEELEDWTWARTAPPSEDSSRHEGHWGLQCALGRRGVMAV